MKKINIDVKPRKRKKVVVLAAIIIILIALTVIYMFKGPYYSRVDMVVTALMVSEENMDAKEVEIIIKGEYIRYIIPNDAYGGKFIINGFYATEWLENVSGFYLGKNVLSNLYYTNWSNPVVEIAQSCPFGYIIADKKFKSFVIIPYEQYAENPSYKGYVHKSNGDFNRDNITVIVYPAETREKAIALANEKLINYFGENFRPMK